MLPKVRKDQSWTPSARAHNAFVDLVNAAGPRFNADIRAGSGRALVKNNTSSSVAQGGVLAITDVLYDATDNEQSFWANEMVFVGDTPTQGTHTGKFAVVAQTIDAGRIGPCYVDGMCPVTVEIDEDWHAFADVKSSTGELKTYPSGGARILWQETGTGAGKKAWVQMDTAPTVMCEFSLTAALAVSGASAAATIAHANVPGYNTESITVHNHDTSGSNNLFEGDSGDKGTAYYDNVADKWYIIQMECP